MRPFLCFCVFFCGVQLHSAALHLVYHHYPETVLDWGESVTGSMVEAGREGVLILRTNSPYGYQLSIDSSVPYDLDGWHNTEALSNLDDSFHLPGARFENGGVTTAESELHFRPNEGGENALMTITVSLP